VHDFGNDIGMKRRAANLHAGRDVPLQSHVAMRRRMLTPRERGQEHGGPKRVGRLQQQELTSVNAN
jgi:hypothetical protein